MPDGDIVHNKLRRLYQKPYKWLCEGKATTDECAQVAMEALKKDLIKKGNLPVILAQSMAASLVQAISTGGENGSVNWAALNVEFDRLIQQTDGRPDLKELTFRAGKSVLHDLRYGQEVDIENASALILKRYMNEVYESEFKERVPLASEHHSGTDEVTLNQRVKDIEPALFVAIHQWANKADANGNIEKLRLPRRRHQLNEIDLNENLLAG